MVALPNHKMTEAEYLAFERQSDVRHEYYDGAVWQMAGASRAHNLITHNIGRHLGNQLTEKPCEIYQNDMRVLVQRTGFYAYPDVVVTCATPQLAEGIFDTLLNPQVLIEVLSPSTENLDRGKKWFHYRRISSLRHYLLIAQATPQIEHYQLQGELWVLREIVGTDDAIQLAALDCTLRLVDIYQRVTFSE